MPEMSTEPAATWFRSVKSHYHFRISLRVRHPDADPDRITQALGITPKRAWRSGARRQTPTGEPLEGSNTETYWYVYMIAGRHPSCKLAAGVLKVLNQLVAFRDFFHDLRSEGGSIELFIAWCFERQSGDVFAYDILAKAAELKIDLSFDVYPPTQPQHEFDVTMPLSA